MDSTWSLQDKIALVTGGSKGIGLASVKTLLGFGATVISVARNEKTLEESAAELGDLPVITMAADLSTEAGRADVMKKFCERYSTLDVLVLNVGTNIRKKSLDYTSAEISQVVGTNFLAAYEMARLFHPLLCRSEQASVIFTGSIAGINTVRSGVPYGASKAALNQTTRGLAVEWAEDRIRVNLVAPGYVETPLTAGVLGNEEFRNYVLSRILLKRIGKPEEIANLIAFLALPAAGYVTGQIFVADGGASAWLL